eukprot:124263-Rhodomonas_salina.1
MGGQCQASQSRGIRHCTGATCEVTMRHRTTETCERSVSGITQHACEVNILLRKPKQRGARTVGRNLVVHHFMEDDIASVGGRGIDDAERDPRVLGPT